MSFFKKLFGNLFHDPSSEFDVEGVAHGGRSIGHWFRALADRSTSARQEAEDALVAIGEPALPALEAACAGGDLNARAAAATALGRIGDAAFDTLVGLMGDEETRICVPLALARTGPSGLPRFLALYKEGDAAAQEGVAYTIAELARATPLLHRPAPVMATTGDPLQPRADTTSAPEPETEEKPPKTVEWDFADFVSLLGADLTSPRETLRREAARALWHIGRKGAAPAAEPLAAALRNDDAETRLFAAAALAELDAHTDAALEAVLAGFADESPDIARLAVHAIPSFRPEAAAAAVDPLLDALLNVDAAVRHHSKLALSHLGAVAVPALVEAAKDRNADLRRRVASVLGDLREHYAAWQDATAKPDAAAPQPPELKARMESVERALPRVIRCLVALAGDEDPSVSERAVRALGFGSLARIPREAFDEYAATLEKLDRIAFVDIATAGLRGTPEQRRDVGLPLFERLEEDEREELVYELLRDMVRSPEIRETGLEALRALKPDEDFLATVLMNVEMWATEESPKHQAAWLEVKEQIEALDE